MRRSRVYDLLLLALIYLAICSIPLELFIKNAPLICLIIRVCLQVAYSIFLVIYLKKQKSLQIEEKHIQFPLILLFLPLLLATVSNFFYIAFIPKDFVNNFEYTFFIECGLYLFVAFNEEMLFRKLLLDNMEKGSTLIKIVVGAAIFGAFHLTDFLSTFSPASLITIVYTFALGIALGFIYEYGGSIICCIGFHFLFNVLNMSLYSRMNNGISNYWVYILVNIAVGAVLGIYLLILYIKKFRTSNQKGTE